MKVGMLYTCNCEGVECVISEVEVEKIQNVAV